MRSATRDWWAGEMLGFPRGRLRLLATNALAPTDETVGFDEGAVDLLYQVHLTARGVMPATVLVAAVFKVTGVTLVNV